MSRPIVFLGPSLPLVSARQILDADYRPPAAQGDILRAAQLCPPAIALIDGVFKDRPTVRHRDILWAMSKGIPVFGAASMGALRAAELSAQGMIGVGLIYRWYRRYPLLPDDAVAVTHGPAALGSLPLSTALVDIRRALRAKVRKNRMSQAEAGILVQEAMRQPFPERKLTEAHQSQKAKDATALLKLLADLSANGDWPKPMTPEPPVIHAWLDDLHDSGLSIDH